MSIEPGSPEQRSYYHKHAERIETCFEDALNAAFDTGASDPVAFVAQHMAAAAAAAAPISAKSAHRREDHSRTHRATSHIIAQRFGAVSGPSDSECN